MCPGVGGEKLEEEQDVTSASLARVAFELLPTGGSGLRFPRSGSKQNALEGRDRGISQARKRWGIPWARY